MARSAKKKTPAKKPKQPRKGAITRVGLPPAQEKFAQAYAITQNGAEAIRRAYPSYKNKTSQQAAVRSSQILGDRKVRERIEQLMQRVVEKANKDFDITAEKVIQEIAAMAFSNADDYFEWGQFERPVMVGKGKDKQQLVDSDGNPVTEPVPYVTIKPSAELTRVQKSAIVGADLSVARDGTRMVSIKMGPKLQALKDLGTHLGLFGKGKIDLNVNHTHKGKIEVDDVRNAPTPVDALKLFEQFQSRIIDVTPERRTA